MPDFHRYFVPGGTYFFTLVTYNRRPLFAAAAARSLLHDALAAEARRRPFHMPGVVLLPEHLHCLWTLPPNDADFSTRWRRIKEEFTRAFLRAGGRELTPTAGQQRKNLRGVWQPRFWEHTIRDLDDFGRHLDYIHYNPVKHGHARCAHAWSWSTFQRWCARGLYERDWCCSCTRPPPNPPTFGLPSDYGE